MPIHQVPTRLAALRPTTWRRLLAPGVSPIIARGGALDGLHASFERRTA